MKFVGFEENQRLEKLLKDALARETRLWKAPIIKNGYVQGSDITPSQYEEVIYWLRNICRSSQFCPETYALGVCTLNRLLATVKAQSKYLKCMAITALILAAKINEEEEVIVPVKELLTQTKCSFSPAEILRMERIILDKLHWELYTATPLDFVHIFHGLLARGHPRLPFFLQKRPGFEVAPLSRQVQHCMASHQLWQFKGSTLALAIITLELERLTPDWFSVFTDLLKKAQVDSSEFIYCKEAVDEHLTSMELSLPTNPVYIFDSLNMLNFRTCDPDKGNRKWADPACLDGGRRGNGRPERDADEFYDGFGCLYSESAAKEVDGGDHMDLSPALPEKGLPCPPLQPLMS